MPSRQPQGGSTLVWLFLWIAVLAAIAYWCATQHVPAIQRQIQLNAEEAVSVARARDVTTSVEGRTVTLNGSVANDTVKAELLSALSAADGIRHVIDDQLTVINSVAAVTQSNDTAVAQPEVPTSPADKPASSEQVSPSAGPAETKPNVQTPEAPSPEAPSSKTPAPATPPEAPTAPTLAPEAPPAAPSAETSAPPAPPSPAAPSAETPAPPAPPSPAAPSTDTPAPPAPPSPAAPSAETLTPIDNTQSTAGDIAELGVANESVPSNLSDAPSPEAEDSEPALIDVLEGESSTFSMQIKDGTLTLTGDISTEDDSLAFIQSAMKTFDVNYVVNSMQENEEGTKASWLPALTEFIPSMQPVSDAKINIFESQVTLSGTVPSEQTHDAIIDEALSLLSGLSLVDSIGISSDNTAPAASAPEPQTTPATEPTTGANTQNTAQNSTQPAPQATTENTAATTAAQLSTLREAFKALEAEKILFRSGSDVLTEQSVLTVEQMSALLSKYTDISIEIDGHTDSDGSSEDNLRLSQLRANAVRDLMIEKGIARERLSAYGFGDGVPIADNNTAEGRKLNRRIEFNF